MLPGLLEAAEYAETVAMLTPWWRRAPVKVRTS